MLLYIYKIINKYICNRERERGGEEREGEGRERGGGRGRREGGGRGGRDDVYNTKNSVKYNQYINY